MNSKSAKLIVSTAVIGLALMGLTVYTTGTKAHSGRHYTAFDLNHQRLLQMPAFAEVLSRSSVILVGEHHANPDHHILQQEIMAMLVTSGNKVAVGLEMFRSESQPALDQWVAGELDEERMEIIFFQNWSYDWNLYRPIFVYAREHGLPMVALNVSPDLTRQVADKGFESLTREQKGALSEITCNVDDRYRRFIQRAYGAHGHGKMDFENFCEAQMVWDDAMALHVVEFLEKHPDHKMVVVAGSGHVRKSAIPTQILKRSFYPLTVVLPFTPGSLDPRRIDHQDADYIVYPASDVSQGQG